MFSVPNTVPKRGRNPIQTQPTPTKDPIETGLKSSISGPFCDSRQPEQTAAFGRSIEHLLALRFPLPERRRRQHVDAPKRIQDQEVLIASDDRGALTGQCRRQHDIVVAVATNWGIERVQASRG